MIRSALGSLQAKPGFYAAVVLAAVVLGWYYASQYRDCTGQREWRERLYHVLGAAGSARQLFNLSEAVPFGWDEVRIRAGAAVEGKVMDCPFGWDWSRTEYDALAGAGLLSLLIFIDEGRLAGHIGFSSDRVDFRDVAGTWTPETAVFEVVHGASLPVRLRRSGNFRRN